MTADFHAIHTYVNFLVIASLSVGGFSRALFGPLSFWVTFMLIESFRLSLFFSLGMFNVSSFLQMAIIMDMRYTKFGIDIIPKNTKIQNTVFNLYLLQEYFKCRGN